MKIYALVLSVLCINFSLQASNKFGEAKKAREEQPITLYATFHPLKDFSHMCATSCPKCKLKSLSIPFDKNKSHAELKAAFALAFKKPEASFILATKSSAQKEETIDLSKFTTSLPWLYAIETKA